jgi:hypothetical protein
MVKEMKLSKAMSEKKAAQNALARLVKMRSASLYYDEKKGPDLEFEEIEKQIQSKIKRIDDLKMRIFYTNCQAKLENNMLLQEAVVKLGNIRSELGLYNELLVKEPVDPRRAYFPSNKTIDFQPQVDKKYIMERIEELESKKYELDALIAKANHTVDLIEKIPR